MACSPASAKRNTLYRYRIGLSRTRHHNITHERFSLFNASPGFSFSRFFCCACICLHIIWCHTDMTWLERRFWWNRTSATLFSVYFRFNTRYSHLSVCNNSNWEPIILFKRKKGAVTIGRRQNRPRNGMSRLIFTALKRARYLNRNNCDWSLPITLYKR